ncbi:MAG: CHC2 zinc finger domain-containing protein, partial [Trebonia sp.]
RERHSIAEVAQRTGIPMSSAAGTITVRCPLPSHSHPDRTPSMRLYLDNDRYYCFGCAARGDVIQWVRDAEGVGVAQAIRVLDSGAPIANAWAGRNAAGHAFLPASGTGPTAQHAELVGQAELPDLDRTPPERVYAALAAAWSYYSWRPLHTRGVAYLTERGIDIGILETHIGRSEVGHTPAKADGLVGALRARGFTDDELVDAGLARRRLGSDPISDFYRQRVLIPVRDNNGLVCGFVGRNVGDVRWPKYKNPPRTHAYDKSVNLYQPLPAPQRRRGRVIVVEGTLDAMAIAVAAIRRGCAHRFCPITQSGRELSASQVESALRLHPGPLLVSFDGDAAGRDSNRRLVTAIQIRGRRAAVVNLPDGADPASWLTRIGPSALDTWDIPAAQSAASVSSDCDPIHLPAL